MQTREQHDQASLVDSEGRALDGARSNDELLTKKLVLCEQLRAHAGHVDEESAHDARRTARVPQRPHHSHDQAGKRRHKSGSVDAAHGAIRADSRAMIKPCSERNPASSRALLKLGWQQTTNYAASFEASTDVELSAPS